MGRPAAPLAARLPCSNGSRAAASVATDGPTTKCPAAEAGGMSRRGRGANPPIVRGQPVSPPPPVTSPWSVRAPRPSRRRGGAWSTSSLAAARPVVGRPPRRRSRPVPPRPGAGRRPRPRWQVARTAATSPATNRRRSRQRRKMQSGLNRQLRRQEEIPLGHWYGVMTLKGRVSHQSRPQVLGGERRCPNPPLEHRLSVREPSRAPTGDAAPGCWP